jgi:hypothetical protein
MEAAGAGLSWEGVSVPGGGFRTVAWLVRLGGCVRDDRLLKIDCVSTGSLDCVPGLVSVPGRVFSTNVGSVLTVFRLFGENHLTL